MSRDYSRRLPAGTKVSAGSPIGRNVTAHFPLVRDFLSAVRGRPGLGVSTGPFLRPDPTGKAAMGIGAGKIGTGLLASDLGMDGAKPRTVIVEFMQLDTSFTAGRGVFSFGDTSNQSRTQFSLKSATSFRRVQLATYSENFNYDLWSQGGTYARIFFAVTYDGDLTLRVRSHCRVFLNDGTPQGVVSRSFTSTLSAPLRTGNTWPLDLMGGGPAEYASMNTQLFNATFIGGRALTEREIDNFYRNPQQIMAAAPSFPYPLLASAPIVVAPIELSGDAVVRAAAAGSLTTSVRLTAGAKCSIAATGALATVIRLGGAAVSRVAAAGELSTAIPLSGAAAARVSAAGALAGAGAALEGSAFASVSASGALSTAIVLAGAASARVTAAGALAGGAAALQGDAAVRAIAAGSRSTEIVLSGAASVRAAATGVLGDSAARAALSGLAVARVSAAGSLSTAILLSGASRCEFGASGRLAGARFDISKISLARLVTFEGSGSRVVPFGSSGSRVTPFEGSGSRVTPFEGSGSRTVRF